jgi:DNA-binding IclR family transcriptional regulator
MQKPKRKFRTTNSTQAGIETIETGMRFLTMLADLHHPQMLKTIAAATGMPPSKAHRYLVSFIRAGFVDRDPETGRYRLGPSAMQLGLSALANVDAVYLATHAIVELRDKLGHTTCLAVWGSHGPTALRFEEARRAVTVNARPGTVLPLLTSSSGQVFAAFMSETKISHILREELRANKARLDRQAPTTLNQAMALIEGVRKHGLGRVMNDMMPGVSALAAPVFNHRGDVVVALAAMGGANDFDARLNGRTAAALLQVAAGVSSQLGYSKERLSRGSTNFHAYAGERVRGVQT